MPDPTSPQPLFTPVVPRGTFEPSLQARAVKVPGEKPFQIPVRVTCFEVLKGAGLEPWEWYRSFVDPAFTFLGRKLQEGSLLHGTLADHLSQIELRLCAAEPAKSALVIGTELGLAGGPNYEAGIALRGSRPLPSSASVSMHFFGLAIDVDYDCNFYVGEEDEDVIVLNQAVRRAWTLLNSETGAIPPNEWIWRKGLLLQEIQAFNQKWLRYMHLLTAPAELEALRVKAVAKPWAECVTAEQALAEIEKDVQAVAKALRDTKGEWRDELTRTGLLTITQRLLNELNLDWGGDYSDYQHFDMRNLGVGKQVYRAIQDYKSDRSKLESLEAEWEPLNALGDTEKLVEFVKRYPRA